jgi:HEAT repeat protein
VVVDAVPPVKLVSKDEAIARAKDILRRYLKAESPRVQRLAAAALSRSGDEEAIDALVAMLAAEPSEVGKTELAYYIARAGDKRGIEALVAAASPMKRETKHEAGRRRALRGDPRAGKVHEGSLTYPQFRLGVSEALAFVREPRALDILNHTLTDAASLPDDKARAAIALGWAGQPSAAPALRELVKSDRDKALAAHALANLHDEAARPELEGQLALPSLRVRAARALRLLSPARDTSPYIQQLVAALATEKDTDQIDAAEALLILAGPADWATDE